MVDTSLRCEEAFAPETPLLVHNNSGYQELIPQFCHAYRDRAILNDARVVSNMRSLEPHYIPNDTSYTELQDEIKLHMRKIVVDWMLEVTVDQSCHIDVFLLSVNIMDRFLDTIRLKKNQFQLLGAASIFLASKMLEPAPIPALTLVKYTADTYDRDELLSMELLILSKLKWDLTAITAHDYLDHLLTLFDGDDHGDDDEHKGKTAIDPKQVDSLRRQTERLITMCATEPTFLTLPPSILASASLASAVLQDFESQPPTVKLKDILDKLTDFAKVEMARLRACIDQIDELLVSDHPDSDLNNRQESTSQSHPESARQMPQSGPTSPPQPSQLSPPSSGFFSSPDRHNRSFSDDPMMTPTATRDKSEEDLDDDEEDNDDHDNGNRRESENKTPTEVFSVVALCVT